MTDRDVKWVRLKQAPEPTLQREFVYITGAMVEEYNRNFDRRLRMSLYYHPQTQTFFQSLSVPAETYWLHGKVP